MSKKEYIVKDQDGGYITMKAWRDKLKSNLTTKRDANKPSTPINNKGAIVQNIFTGRAVTPEDVKNNVVGTPLVRGGTPQGVIDKPYVRSLRENIIGGLNKVDRDGDNMVFGLVTEPLKSAARILRPDKYFKDVQGDQDILPAVGRLAMDAGNAAMVGEGLGGGAKKLLNWVPGETGHLRNLEALRDAGKFEEAIEYQYDPRSVAERGIDGVHGIYKNFAITKPGTGDAKSIADFLNTNKKLTDLRRDYTLRQHAQQGPMTHENIVNYANSDKAVAVGDGMMLTRTPLNMPAVELTNRVKTPRFGDGTLLDGIKSRLTGKVGEMPEYDSNITLVNDQTKGQPSLFSANVNPVQKSITNYNFFATGKAQQLEAGRFAGSFMRNAPDGYLYEPGSLSADSFTMLSNGLNKMKGRYVPEVNDFMFGNPAPLNKSGINSKLAKALKGGKYVEAKQMVSDLNLQNLKNLGFDDEAAGLLTKRVQLQGSGASPQRIKIPVRKVPEGQFQPLTPEYLNRVKGESKQTISRLQEFENQRLQHTLGNRPSINPDTGREWTIDELTLADSAEQWEQQATLHNQQVDESLSRNINSLRGNEPFEVPVIAADGSAILTSEGAPINYTEQDALNGVTYGQRKSQELWGNSSNPNIGGPLNDESYLRIRGSLRPDMRDNPLTGLGQLDHSLGSNAAWQGRGDLNEQIINLRDRLYRYNNTGNGTSVFARGADLDINRPRQPQELIRALPDELRRTFRQ